MDKRSLFFLPGAFGERQAISAFEQVVIRCLQAPTQQWHAKRAPLEARDARPYPRQRQPPTVQRELELLVGQLLKLVCVVNFRSAMPSASISDLVELDLCLTDEIV